jgi:hypothetical protein
MHQQNDSSFVTLFFKMLAETAFAETTVDVLLTDVPTAVQLSHMTISFTHTMPQNDVSLRFLCAGRPSNAHHQNRIKR